MGHLSIAIQAIYHKNPQNPHAARTSLRTRPLPERGFQRIGFRAKLQKRG